jgi:hypothetical protein
MPIPEVLNRKSAADAGTACAVKFQKAGSFPVEFALVYRVSWTVNQWSFEVPPPADRGSTFAAIPFTYTVVVQERQPIVTG